MCTQCAQQLLLTTVGDRAVLRRAQYRRECWGRAWPHGKVAHHVDLLQHLAQHRLRLGLVVPEDHDGDLRQAHLERG